jgi:hypothetical protein
MNTAEITEGGCLCGAVRLRAAGAPLAVTYCHCRDCRKATGAPVTAFAGYRSEQVEMTGRAPRRHESSPGVWRAHCGDCGSPISYEDARLPGEVYLLIGVFDAPERFAPERHGWVSRKLPWLHIGDDLPRHDQSTKPRGGANP